MKIILIFLFSILSSVLPQQWIDPHDMNPKPKRNLGKSASTGDLKQYTNQPNYEAHEENAEESNSIIYMKRFVNLLLNSATVDKSDPITYHSKISFNLDDKSFQFLKDFSDSKKVSLDQLRKLDTILSEMFRKRYLDDFSDMLILSQDKFLNLLFSKNSLPFVGLCVFIYIAYNLIRSNFSLWYVFRYFVFIIIVVDYIQRYQQLTEEAEEHNMHLKYTTKCDSSKMSWKEYFQFLTSHEDCEKKVVSLLEVGLLQVKSIIIIPLSAAGTGMGHFGAELWGNLPFPWNILIFPIMLIFCICLVVIVMTVFNGTPFKVNLMHLFHVEFGEKKNGIGNATLDKLLDVVGRPQIVDIREKRKERYIPKEKKPPKAIEEKKLPNKENNKSKQKPSNSKNGSNTSDNKTKLNKPVNSKLTETATSINPQ